MTNQPQTILKPKITLAQETEINQKTENQKINLERLWDFFGKS